jgi:hypothetical protein
MGGDIQDFAEAVVGAVTGETDRLKQFGIVAKTQGDKVSFTFDGVTTTIRRNAEEINEFLTRLGETRFAGSAAREMNTLGGAFSNLQDAIARSADAVGRAGLSDAIIDVTRQLSDLAIGSDDVQKSLGEGLGNVVRKAGEAMAFLAQNIEVVTSALTVLISTRIGAFFGPYGAAIGFVTGLLIDFFTNVEKSNEHLVDFETAMGRAAEAVSKLKDKQGEGARQAIAFGDAQLKAAQDSIDALKEQLGAQEALIRARVKQTAGPKTDVEEVIENSRPMQRGRQRLRELMVELTEMSRRIEALRNLLPEEKKTKTHTETVTTTTTKNPGGPFEDQANALLRLKAALDPVAAGMAELAQQQEMLDGALAKTLLGEEEQARLLRFLGEKTKEFKLEQAGVSELFEDTSALGEYNADIAALKELVDDGTLSWQEYSEAVGAAQARLAEDTKVATEDLKTTMVDLEGAGRQFGSAFASELEAAIFQAKSLDDVLKSLLSSLGSAVFQAGVAAPLQDAFAGIGSSVSGLFGGTGEEAAVGAGEAVAAEGAAQAAPELAALAGEAKALAATIGGTLVKEVAQAGVTTAMQTGATGSLIGVLAELTLAASGAAGALTRVAVAGAGWPLRRSVIRVSRRERISSPRRMRDPCHRIVQLTRHTLRISSSFGPFPNQIHL